MTEIGMPLLDRDTSKANYGAPVFNQWRVAIDAYEQMVLFLELTPHNMKFTQHDREKLWEMMRADLFQNFEREKELEREVDEIRARIAELRGDAE